jgi:hypothetical protein
MGSGRIASINITVPHPTTQAYGPGKSASCPLVRISAWDSFARPRSNDRGLFIAFIATHHLNELG